MAKLCLLGAKKITLVAKTKAFLSLDTRWQNVFEVTKKSRALLYCTVQKFDKNQIRLW